MRITEKFFEDNKTKAGGWTAAQVEVLGLKYPLKKGWQKRLIGKEISEETAKKFSRNRFVYSGDNGKRYVKCSQRDLQNILFEDYFQD